MMRIFRALSVLLGLTFFVSCTYPVPEPTALAPTLNLVTVDPNASATPTPFQPVGATFTPPPSATLPASLTPPPSNTPLSTNTLPATATFTLAPPTPTATTAPLPASTRTQYTFYVLFDYAGKQLAVDESIAYTNQTGTTLSNIVLAVEANLRPDSFLLETMFVDGVSAQYSLDGQRLTIFLPTPLVPGAQTTLSMRYTLAIPPKRFEQPYGYLGYQINLTDWYPFVVPYEGNWVLHDPWAFGEHLVYDSADFDVNLKVLQPDITIAASALPEENGEWTHYRLIGARTFVFSASDRYIVAETAVGAVVVRSYYFSWHEGGGRGIFDAAWKAVGLFETKFGPYPYDVLNVVETDVPDGQEYDGLVFLATEFYDSYGGSAKSDLITIGVHEISHEWWFGLVGNDQALEPWLDETMATYSEEIFYEFSYPAYGNWWWNFRVYYYSPSGWVDTSIYAADGFRPYVNAVYMQGAVFIDNLRTRIGDQDFFAFLKDYTFRYGRQRATAYDFFTVLRENTSVDFSDLEAAYFQGDY